MKLLGMKLSEHDANFAYYDGSKVQYIKTERILQDKHHGYELPEILYEWEDFIKNQWGITSSDIDHIGLVLDSSRHGLPSTKDFPRHGYEEFFPAKCPVTHYNHHASHALSVWPLYDQPIENQIIIDGRGDNADWYTVSKKGKIVDNMEMFFFTSFGSAMEWVGRRFLGLNYDHVGDVAGKVMGLQSHGNVDYDFINKYLSALGIKEGRILFDALLWKMYKGDDKLAEMTLLDWIASVHEHAGDILLGVFGRLFEKDEIIHYSGGVAHNVVWNTKLKKAFPNLIVAPQCDDEGISLGALWQVAQEYNIDLRCHHLPSFPYCQDDEAPSTTASIGTIETVAEALAQGKIVGWYQGNGEIGPRALGNRSLLFNPTISNGRDIVNKVKKREGFRPFGASVLHEHKHEYFDNTIEDKYMLYTANVLPNRSLPAITHVDGSCRVQSVDKSNGIFYDLLQKFYELTNCPVLLNTSLNIAGKPIAGSVDDCKWMIDNMAIDIMVIGDEIIYNESI